MTGFNTAIVQYEPESDGFETAYDHMCTWLENNVGYRELTVDDLHSEVLNDYQLTDGNKIQLVKMGGFTPIAINPRTGQVI